MQFPPVMRPSAVLFIAAIGAVYLLVLIAALATKPGAERASWTERRLRFRAMTALAIVVWSMLLLTACGGGDPEPEQQQPTPPDCRNHPEQCT